MPDIEEKGLVIKGVSVVRVAFGILCLVKRVTVLECRSKTSDDEMMKHQQE